MMPRRTRRVLAALAIVLIGTTAAVDVGDDARWLEATTTTSSFSSGSHADVTPSPTATVPFPSPSSVPGSPTATPVSDVDITPLPSQTATRPPVPTFPTPATTAPVTRPPGSPSTPNADVHGAPIAVAPTRAPRDNRATTPPPTISIVSPRATSSSSSANGGPRTKDTRTVNATNQDTGASDAQSESESDSDSESSASGSGDSSGSSSSSSSSSSIEIPPVPTLPMTTTAPPAVQSHNATAAPTTPVTTRSSPSAFHAATLYTSVVCGAMAVILLAFLHLFAFDAPWLNWPHEWLSANGWELVLLVGYLQHFVSLSQLELLAMPSFLAQFGDAFAWSAFLVQRTALVHSMPSRRHDEATIAKGVDAFGDRIGIYDASDLVVNGVVGVAVVFGVLCFVFFALWVCGHHVPEDKFDLESSVVSAMAAAPTRRRGTLWVLGFGVTLWFVALYPLTALATFDLESVHANTALAVVILVIVAVVLLGAFAYAILSKSDEQLMSINSLKVFGALYADVTYGCRWFFVVTALAQIALGVCVGAIRDESTQLTVALVITIGYLAIVLLCSPFTSQTPLLLTIAVGGLKVLNYSIAFAFVSEKKLSMAARNRAGDAIVVLTMLVMLLWLVRVLVMLATFVRLYAERRSAVAETPAFYGARESVKEGMNLDTNPILGGSGVYVTLMMSPPQRLGSEHGNSLDELLPRRTGRLAQL